jgi:hypothetical protein
MSLCRRVDFRERNFAQTRDQKCESFAFRRECSTEKTRHGLVGVWVLPPFNYTEKMTRSEMVRQRNHDLSVSRSCIQRQRPGAGMERFPPKPVKRVRPLPTR